MKMERASHCVSQSRRLAPAGQEGILPQGDSTDNAISTTGLNPMGLEKLGYLAGISLLASGVNAGPIPCSVKG